MVASGLGLTLIPACSEPYLLTDGLITRPLDPPPHRRMVAVWRRRFPRTRAMRALVDALQALQLLGTRKPS
jgi:DNA-binding transcriptional LysR family regulator